MATVDRPQDSLALEWESLVTEGHVRAARVRWMQPWIIAAAVIAILLSFYLASAVRRSTSNDSVEVTPVSDRADQVRAALAGLPPLQVQPTEGNTLAPFQQIGTIVVPQLLAELKRDDRLGTANIKVTPLSTDEFWHKEWPHAGLVGTGTGDVRLVGAIANQGSVNYVTATRWLGVFRKRDGQWQLMSAADPGFSALDSTQNAPLENIPLTLKPVLPVKE